MKVAKHKAWSDRAEAGLEGTLGEDRDSIVASVNDGRCELWEFGSGACWLITCVTDGELAVCCVKGGGLVEVTDWLVGLACRQGLRRVRWFTRRKAMQRLLKKHMPVLAGYVFHIELQGLH